MHKGGVRSSASTPTSLSAYLINQSLMQWGLKSSLLQTLDSRRVLVGTPSTQGAGIRLQNTPQIQILRHFEKTGSNIVICA